MVGKPLRQVKRRGPTGIIAEQALEFRLKISTLNDLNVPAAQFLYIGKQHFGNESAAKFAVISFLVNGCHL